MVTLIERSYWEQLTDHHDSAPDKVWGVAYRIVADKVAEVKEYLDIREINGYTIHYTPFHPAPSLDASLPPQREPIHALVYIGTPDNEQFVGPEDPQQLAEHIYHSQGPSGLNRDYLWGLEEALNGLSVESEDEHVTDLSNRARAVAAAIAEKGGISSHPDGVVALPANERRGHFIRATSVDEQEETEKVA